MKSLLCTLLFLLIALLGAQKATASMQFDRAQLTISGSKENTFIVEVAYSEEQRQRGLMYRQHLAEDAGMLFVFPEEQAIGMWMKNTYIPLDMLFIDKHGVIISTTHNTTPMSEQVIYSPRHALWVLELPAGTSKRLAISTGDKVRYQLLP